MFIFVFRNSDITPDNGFCIAVQCVSENNNKIHLMMNHEI